jgi:catechol 2,3-dioxygenase-like lactoylglutathione lyase family enzyme
MKTIICLVLVLVLNDFDSAFAGDQQKPKGMTLRLELFVTDMEKSIDFYTKVLGFERLGGEPDYVPVRSGSVLIGLGPAKGLTKQHHFNPEVQNGRRGLGTEIVLEVDDVKGFFKKVKASGYKGNISRLRQQSWGLTDFRIVDPDGYYLRITSR